jgi:hypothetical protein
MAGDEAYDSARDRFERRVDRSGENGCWNWTGSLTPGGYGRLRVDGLRPAAHRFSYELHIGLIPDGLQLDHLCRNRRCVNPAHLEPVTARENTLRGEAPSARRARQTHCVRGHAFSGGNLRLKPSGKRECRACDRAGQRSRRALNREAINAAKRRSYARRRDALTGAGG